MHPNPAFRTADAARNLAFARDRGFGTLCLNGSAGPLISHIPFVLSDSGHEARLHLLRSNPIVRATTAATPAAIAVTGPDAYVSPDWYGDPGQVPTWNYIAVHLRGALEPRPQEELRADLDLLSAHFEHRLLPKPPWTTAKMEAGALDRMMRTIRPFRFHVESVEGTWKMNQNKTPAQRLGAAEGVETGGIGSETAHLAALMRAVKA
ncbi:Protease synthase and sporulation protein PAI 2 [Pseudoruegeria aquimaris]|uniref:Protease synthase and sporulation protein PAI 2 n=1 Tax=Pseudoruegeria aquimaris TaxID=393663 RepID=A0A1Y5RY05_9RHOB|nr:FMN-binding negative transcriptional regulator [Pseudoruegeria aquimaris]SLN28153.1 Protease synthase and sporulation protein PAI 2 [Pseudoruegeria aquimaris]